MSAFKLRIVYSNPSYEEIREIEASDSVRAVEVCDGLLAEDGRKRDDMASKNIYCSRKIVRCELMEVGWREAILRMPRLENDI